VRPQIRGDSRGRLRTLGLLGDKVFDISPGTPRTLPLAAGDTIALSASLDYDAIIQQASGAVGDVVGLTGDLRTVTAGIVEGRARSGSWSPTASCTTSSPGRSSRRTPSWLGCRARRAPWAGCSTTRRSTAISSG
jgi:hypothetical protein